MLTIPGGLSNSVHRCIKITLRSAASLQANKLFVRLVGRSSWMCYRDGTWWYAWYAQLGTVNWGSPMSVISASPAPHSHSLQSKLFPTHVLSGLSHLTPSGRKYKVNSWAHMTNLRLGLLVGVVWANKMQLQSMHVPATLAERTQLSVVHRLLTIPLHT